jgi:hypothetical protein
MVEEFSMEKISKKFKDSLIEGGILWMFLFLVLAP